MTRSQRPRRTGELFVRASRQGLGTEIGRDLMVRAARQGHPGALQALEQEANRRADVALAVSAIWAARGSAAKRDFYRMRAAEQLHAETLVAVAKELDGRGQPLTPLEKAISDRTDPMHKERLGRAALALYDAGLNALAARALVAAVEAGNEDVEYRFLLRMESVPAAISERVHRRIRVETRATVLSSLRKDLRDAGHDSLARIAEARLVRVESANAWFMEGVRARGRGEEVLAAYRFAQAAQAGHAKPGKAVKTVRAPTSWTRSERQYACTLWRADSRPVELMHLIGTEAMSQADRQAVAWTLSSLGKSSDAEAMLAKDQVAGARAQSKSSRPKQRQGTPQTDRAPEGSAGTHWWSGE